MIFRESPLNDVKRRQWRQCKNLHTNMSYKWWSGLIYVWRHVWRTPSWNFLNCKQFIESVFCCRCVIGCNTEVLFTWKCRVNGRFAIVKKINIRKDGMNCDWIKLLQILKQGSQTQISERATFAFKICFGHSLASYNIDTF